MLSDIELRKRDLEDTQTNRFLLALSEAMNALGDYDRVDFEVMKLFYLNALMNVGRFDVANEVKDLRFEDMEALSNG